MIYIELLMIFDRYLISVQDILSVLIVLFFLFYYYREKAELEKQLNYYRKYASFLLTNLLYNFVIKYLNT